ncbi:MAG: type II secretion system F family protein [Desulfobulbaceae bacterium]|nr:type II secretion system F family protein [Desulfobulbaceae bacterium]
METYALIIAGGVFLLIIVMVSVIGRYGSRVMKERDIVGRAMRYGEGSSTRSFLETDGGDREAEGFASEFKELLNVVGRRHKGERTEVFTEVPKRFQDAGIYSSLHIRLYNSVQYGLLVAVPGAAFLFLLLTRRNFTPQFGLGVVALAIIGYLLPPFWLQLRAILRKKRIERYFPDAIDLLVVCVESGMGLDAAIHRVSLEMATTSPDLALEFKILSLELRTGKARSECLKNLGKRVEITDVANLINLLIQAEKFGTGVAKALRVHSEEMRQKRFNRFEEEAAKLPTKLVIPLILFIFPALFAVIMGPAMIQVYRIFME